MSDAGEAHPKRSAELQALLDEIEADEARAASGAAAEPVIPALGADPMPAAAIAGGGDPTPEMEPIPEDVIPDPRPEADSSPEPDSISQAASPEPDSTSQVASPEHDSNPEPANPEPDLPLALVERSPRRPNRAILLAASAAAAVVVVAIVAITVGNNGGNTSSSDAPEGIGRRCGHRFDRRGRPHHRGDHHRAAVDRRRTSGRHGGRSRRQHPTGRGDHLDRHHHHRVHDRRRNDVERAGPGRGHQFFVGSSVHEPSEHHQSPSRFVEQRTRHRDRRHRHVQADRLGPGHDGTGETDAAVSRVHRGGPPRR